MSGDFHSSRIKTRTSPRLWFCLTHTHSSLPVVCEIRGPQYCWASSFANPKHLCLNPSRFLKLSDPAFLPLAVQSLVGSLQENNHLPQKQKTKVGIFIVLSSQELPHRPFPFVSGWSICSWFRTFQVGDWTMLTIAKSQPSWLPTSRLQLKQFFQLREARKLVLLPKLAQQLSTESSPVRNNLPPAMWGQPLYNFQSQVFDSLPSFLFSDPASILCGWSLWILPVWGNWMTSSADHVRIPLYPILLSFHSPTLTDFC